MEVFIQKDGVKKHLGFSGSAGELLKKLKINPVTVLVVRNGKIVLEDEVLKDGDKVKILSVVSGG